MENLSQLERRVQAIYDKTLLPLAKRTAFELPMSQKDATGLPTVLFLGNHSSGKSSFINLLIENNVQKTGLAPTDDGFTIITHGHQNDECDGQTVVTHPDLPFRNLQRLGPNFLSRLRLKTTPHDMLKSVTLVDSPGMIDGANSSNNRGYDFTSSVRFFAEQADLILFFFDPDKPGTTGETIQVFNDTLVGLEYKLLIVLNKVDLFSNVRDFARTYGTLCWKLSQALQIKDMPHIYNTYLPPQASPRERHSDEQILLKDFDVSREEVIREIRRVPSRRADNLVSALYQNAVRLSMHTRICQEIAGQYHQLRAKLWGLVTMVIVLFGLGSWFANQSTSSTAAMSILLAGFVLAGAIIFFSRSYLRNFLDMVMSHEGLDATFERIYRHELTMADRADLRGHWEHVRKHSNTALRMLGPEALVGTFATKKWLTRLDAVVDDEIPKLRRTITSAPNVQISSTKAGSDSTKSNPA